jgi:hypothetical protein
MHEGPVSVVTLVPDAAGLELLFSQTGPVGKLVEVKSEEIRTKAHAIVSGGGRPYVRSGDLERTLGRHSKITPSAEGIGTEATIGEDLKEVLGRHRGFYYPAALELGMPTFAPLKPGQSPYGPYRFLRQPILDSGFLEGPRT